VFKLKAQVAWEEGPPTDSWYVRPEYAGGGPLTDMGVHPIDTFSFLFHDDILPTRVFAQMKAHFRPIEVEDTANVIIEYENGMAAILEAGFYHNFSDGLAGSVQVFGTEGYARTFPTELHCRIAGTWGQFRPNMPPRSMHQDLAMYAEQLDHFVDCVLNDEPPYPGGHHGQRAVAVLEAAYRSARTGESVSL
jgi:predicted dehydrogenase